MEGISGGEAQRLLLEVGPNKLKREAGPSVWRLLLRQFNSPLIWLLLGACLLSIAVGELADSIAIIAIVILNGLFGFVQEYRAERAMAALLALTAPRARVMRDGRSSMISAEEIVPGDLILLDAGDIVAADAELLEAHTLLINEAILTGESAPAEKCISRETHSSSLAEKSGFVFSGTHVANGSGKALVRSTGMQTEIGKIAHLLTQTTQTQTPLQIRLAALGRTLLYISLALVAVVAITGLIRHQPWLEIMMSSISLAVAAVPEGLPAIVTIALAIGVQRMSNRNVLVRSMPAIEALGSTTVICTDKTGTLTTGVMQVRELWGSDHKALLFAAAACCDAELKPGNRSGIGDPTEVAILMAASERKIHRDAIERDYPRRNVNPFDSERKRMSIYRSNGVLYAKGAVESILSQCSEVTPGVQETSTEMAERGLRVLAVATGDSAQENGLKFLGLLGIADPPRTEAMNAVADARTAGIRTIMITGDHPVTARAIARELGILTDDDALSGFVHARVTPADKIQIVRNWKEKGEIVSMTGDGVNDAPALREAHVGIAMGITGTEVAKESADVVLTDDNFASIVAAIREGRGIYENIQKAIVYLLTGNTSELLVMLCAAVVGLPVPLLPIHLLWINLVTDGLPALALVMDPASPNAMRRPPRDPDELMLGKPEWKRILFNGTLETIVVLAAFVYQLKYIGIDGARSFGFATLVFSQMFRAFSARSNTRIFWEVGAFNNLWLLGVIMLTIALQISVYYIPVTKELFQLESMPLVNWIWAFLLGLIPVSVIEIQKLLRRWYAPC